MIWSSGVESATPTTTCARNLGGQFPAALSSPDGNDRAARTGAHPQPEAVRTRAAPIVWLEGPLALCHCYYSFMSVTFSADITYAYIHDACDVLRRISPLVLLTRHRRGTYEILDYIPDHVRVAAVSPTFGRLFEGTDLLDAGQTGHRRHIRIPPARESVSFPEVVTDVSRSVGGPDQKLLASANAVSPGRMHRNHPHGPMPIEVGHRLTGPPEQVIRCDLLVSAQ